MFSLISFLVFVSVSERIGEVVLGSLSDHLNSYNSDPSPCFAMLLEVTESIDTLLGFLILPTPLLTLPSFKVLHIPREVAMFLPINLKNTALKTQN